MKLGRKQILLLMLAIMLFALPFLFASCKKDSTSSVNFKYDKETVPTMSTDSVDMLISDSGIIRYRIVAKTWDIFEQAKDPHWLYPRGFYFEQFDSTFKVVVTVKADTAWNYTSQKLWRFKGNVYVTNRLGETFASEELFWNQQKEKIYSDKLVTIDRPDKGILQGRGGFELNQQMTEYEFKNVGEASTGKTIIYVKEDEGGEGENIE